MSKLIASAWDSYQRRVIPATAGDIQRTDTRLAFYAGAAAVFSGICGGVVGNEHDPITAGELAMLEGINAELAECRDQAKRRAARARL